MNEIKLSLSLIGKEEDPIKRKFEYFANRVNKLILLYHRHQRIH